MNCININRYIFKMDSLTLLTAFRNDASFFAFPRAPCVAMVTSLKPKIRERAPVSRQCADTFKVGTKG